MSSLLELFEEYENKLSIPRYERLRDRLCEVETVIEFLSERIRNLFLYLCISVSITFIISVTTLILFLKE